MIDLPGGKEKTLELVTQQDEKGRPYEVSHYCHTRRDELCLETSHFDMEARSDNSRRMSHQNGIRNHQNNTPNPPRHDQRLLFRQSNHQSRSRDRQGRGSSGTSRNARYAALHTRRVEAGDVKGNAGEAMRSMT